MILNEKITIVSRIGPGFGRALAVLAAEEGSHVAVCARTASKLDDVEREIEKAAPAAQLLKMPTDIQDRGACRRFVHATIERFGRIDVLINSAYTAGGYAMADVADLDD